MQKYHILPYLILRQSGRNPGTYHTDLQTMKDDKSFMEALRFANPYFHRKIAANEILLPKDQQTLHRYFNRFCFRPTPFGLFSSISLIGWGSEKAPAWKPGKVHTQLSMELTAALVPELTSDSNLKVMPNPTLYRRHKEYRFIRTDLDQESERRDYLLQSISYSAILKRLLNFCADGLLPAEVARFIQKETLSTAEEAENYTGFLVASQILVPVLRQNLTGRDYLHQLYEQYLAHDEEHQHWSAAGRLFHQLYGHQRSAAQAAEFAQQLIKSLPARYDLAGKPPLNIIMTRRQAGVLVSAHQQENLQHALFALSKLCERVKPIALSNFIKEFVRYFDGQSVPLLMALDPESGIGYPSPGPLPSESDQETLLSHEEQHPAISWTAIQRYLMNKWHASLDKGSNEIVISEEELHMLPAAHPEKQENGFSMLFRVVNGRMIIESGGGVQPAALAGRFTLADNEILEAARSMTAHEEQLNPDILFAEVLHLTDPKTDNVNRRENVWKWDLPLTAGSVLPPERQLELADLLVSCTGGTVVIRSKKYNQVVMPRLTSAYNHSLNRLPLFRFLIDVGYQFGQANYSFDLTRIFPGLNRYPRVVFQGVVLSSACWVLDKKMLDQMGTKDEGANLAAFKKISQTLGLPAVFSWGQHDRQLIFNQTKEADILLFCASVSGLGSITVKEVAGIDTEMTDLPSDVGCQYNAFILPTAPYNIPAVPAFQPVSGKVRRKFLPGSEWLYLKIYQPAVNTNRLLMRLRPLLLLQKSGVKHKKWFFVRYADPAPHIRIRFLIEPKEIGSLLSELRTLIQDESDHHLIREVQVDTYSREMERYHMVPIMDVESHFAAGSFLVAAALSEGLIDMEQDCQLFAMRTTLVLLQTFVDNETDMSDFALENFEAFRAERCHRKTHVELDSLYRSWQKKIEQQMGIRTNGSGRINKAMLQFRSSAEQLREAISDTPVSNALLQSLIHMHLNRVFEKNARYYEMVTYYLLHKFLRSKIMRSKPASM